MSPQKVKVLRERVGQLLIIGDSRLARFKSFCLSQEDRPEKLQEKSFLFLAVWVIMRPRPKSPIKPKVTRDGIGAGVEVGVGLAPMPCGIRGALHSGQAFGSEIWLEENERGKNKKKAGIEMIRRAEYIRIDFAGIFSL